MWIDSEGTLQPEQRQFGPSIRASAFVPSRKNTINVPGFYAAKKKEGHAHPLSMECKKSVQTPVNSAIPEAPQRPVHKQQGCNVQPEFTPSAEPLSTQPNGDNCEIQCVINENITIAVLDEAISQNYSQLKELDSKLSNFISHISSHSMPNDCSPHLAHNADQVHEKQHAPISESRASHEMIRDFINPSKQRVLPTWCRHARPGQPTNNTAVESHLGKKRILDTIESQEDLPSKRQQVLHDNGGVSFILVEADHQPRQEQ